MSKKDASCHEQLLRTVALTWLNIRQRGKKMLADMDYDLTFEQVFVLQVLQEEEEGLQLGVLAEKADRERTTMSRMIDGLEKRNLAVRIPDKRDRRQKLIYLTQLGRERNKQTVSLMSDFIKTAFRGLQKRHIEVALETLQAICANSVNG